MQRLGLWLSVVCAGCVAEFERPARGDDEADGFAVWVPPGADAGVDAEGDGPSPDARARDAAEDRDAAPDAAEGPDAHLPDAAPAPDAADRDPDAAPVEPDAVPPPEDWGPCSVQGVPGRCIPTDECGDGRHPTPGFCPGPGHIQCCTQNDEVFGCDPRDHPQPNGGLAEAPGAGGCPAGMVPVEGFCIDRYEASLVTLDGQPWSPYHNPGAREVRAVSVAGAVPQGYINGVQAAAACQRAGKRLCSDAEWMRACRGAAEWTYPYGPNRQPGVCNDARAVHPAVELFPDDPNRFSRLQDACINQLPDSVAPTGEHDGCVTPEGAFDLMGNLHEWTADPQGTFRGGFYVDTVINGNGCLYRTTAHDTGHWDYSTGFRCCAGRR